MRLVGRPVVRVGLDALDGAPADLVERRLPDLRCYVAGEQLFLDSVLSDMAALARIRP